MNRSLPVWGTIAAIALVVAACLSGQPPTDATGALGQGGSEIDLAASAPGDWERAYVFGQYETGDTLQNALCFPWSHAEEAAQYTKSDGVYVIVFTRGDSVVSWATVNHMMGQGPAVAFDHEPPFFVEHPSARFRAEDAVAGSRLLTAERPLPPACP